MYLIQHSQSKPISIHVHFPPMDIWPMIWRTWENTSKGVKIFGRLGNFKSPRVVTCCFKHEFCSRHKIRTCVTFKLHFSAMNSNIIFASTCSPKSSHFSISLHAQMGLFFRLHFCPERPKCECLQQNDHGEIELLSMHVVFSEIVHLIKWKLWWAAEKFWLLIDLCGNDGDFLIQSIFCMNIKTWKFQIGYNSFTIEL